MINKSPPALLVISPALSLVRPILSPTLWAASTVPSFASVAASAVLLPNDFRESSLIMTTEKITSI